MRKYTIAVQEIHIQHYEIEADSILNALNILDDNIGNEDYFIGELEYLNSPKSKRQVIKVKHNSIEKGE